LATLTLTSQDLAKTAADALVLGLAAGRPKPKVLGVEGLPAATRRALADAVAVVGATGSADSVVRIPGVAGLAARSVVFAGLGEARALTPEALRRAAGSRNRWFDDYVEQSIERDVLELSRVRQRQVLRDLLYRLAGRTGQVLNLSRASDGLGADRKTIEGHTRLLEDLFLITRLPAWGKTLRARATATPKIHVVDSGLAARLMRVTPAKLATLDSTALTEFGNLLETFVVGELRKQISWLDEPSASGHWRTQDGDEVDFVVEFDDGRVLAFEVKAKERISGADFKGLRKLGNALGDRLIAGVVLNTGVRSYTFEDRLHVMPLDRLWRPVHR